MHTNGGSGDERQGGEGNLLLVFRLVAVAFAFSGGAHLVVRRGRGGLARMAAFGGRRGHVWVGVLSVRNQRLALAFLGVRRRGASTLGKLLVEKGRIFVATALGTSGACSGVAVGDGNTRESNGGGSSYVTNLRLHT